MRSSRERSTDALFITDRVLHVVSMVTDYRHHEVRLAGPLLELGRLHRARADDGLLWVVHDVGTGVRAHPVVGARETHALLDHRGSARDPRRRVVLGVWDECGADS